MRLTQWPHDLQDAGLVLLVIGIVGSNPVQSMYVFSRLSVFGAPVYVEALRRTDPSPGVQAFFNKSGYSFKLNIDKWNYELKRIWKKR
jgi:hypothetical protein